MKKIFTFLALVIVTTGLFAQAPEGIIYQAEARDNAGNIIENKMLDVKITILEESINGVIAWEGLHNVTTNKQGMFVLVIGAGTNTYGYNFEDINWGNSTHFLNVQVKKSETTDWIDMGTTQFLSVPYALHAKTAGSLATGLGSELKSAKAGVPSQTWSLFGNSKTNPEKDKIGTTDAADLVFITDNVERLRITTEGELITADGVGLELGGNLAVHGDTTYIDKDFHVGRNVYLNVDESFNPDGNTYNYGSFTVEEGSPTYLSGVLTVEQNTDLQTTLNVDGETDLNSKLRVNNGSSTLLSGSLTVNGVSQFDNNANMDGNFSVNTDKFKIAANNGNTEIAGDLDVAGKGEFANLTVSGNGSTKGEHVALFENTTGGTADGIAIKINKEETTAENNFITFYRQDVVAGRIEGYHFNTLDGQPPAFVSNVIEPMLRSTGTFFIETLGFETPIDLNLDFISLTGGSLPSLSGGSLPGLDIRFLKAEFDFNKGSFPTLNKGSFPTLDFESPISFNTGVTEIIQPWTWFKPDWGALITSTNNPVYTLFAEAYENDWKSLTDMGITELFIKAAEMELEANIKSEGITYGSKGADYAEWLQRVNEEDNLELGQVVGVTGGKISLNTENADQILVISSKPIVLGNMPDHGKEELFEKVAFMGQVPTWVKGHVNIGDYILSSGKNDGAGIAISPEKITVEDIPRIVGKAWSDSNNPVLSLINVAIGLNRNDMAKVVTNQQKHINDLEARLENIEDKINNMTGIFTENK